MKKKILSFAIASMLLLQMVPAHAETKSLCDYVSELFPAYCDNDTLQYSKMRQISDSIFLKGSGALQAKTIDVDETSAVKLGVESKTSTQSAVHGDSFGTYSSSSSTSTEFDFKVTLAMSNVKKAFTELIAWVPNGNIMDRVLASNVTGEFVVKITYDNRIAVPSNLTASDESTRINEIKTNFTQGDGLFKVTGVSAPATDPSNSGKKVVNVTFGIDTPKTAGYIAADDCKAIGDMSVTLSGFTTSEEKIDLPVTAELSSAYTDFTGVSEAKPYIHIDYKAEPTTAYIKVSSGGGGGGTPIKPPTPPTPPTPPMENEAELSTDDPDVEIGSTVNEDGSIEVIIDDKTPTEDKEYVIVIPSEPEDKEGFETNGWSTTPYAGGDDKYDGSIVIHSSDINDDGSVTLYPRYVNVTAPEEMSAEDHVLYIVGYPDGEVKPKGNITREEVFAAFYRLLDPGFRETIEETDVLFPDMTVDRWSNKSVSTMANGGFVVGDENGNVNPGDAITRAEFATIASKFAPANALPAKNYFTDISDHWAMKYILIVAGQYWVSGYGDGTFKPDSYITRAEAMSIINRMLVRYADHETAYAREWPDLYKTDWYYDAVIEATTHNYYARLSNGWSEAWVDDAEKDTRNSVDEIMIDTYGTTDVPYNVPFE